MSIVCAYVPNYRVALARLKGADGDVPLIVADRLERGHAIALCERAYESGARTGMTLVQATAAAPHARVVVDDPARGRELWERALDALEAASPLVEDAEEGVAFLEMRGIPGNEHRYLQSVREAFAADGELAALPLNTGFASNKFVARAAAYVRDGTIVRAGDERVFVAPLPLRALALGESDGVDADTIERLELLGVKNLRALAALPHGPFVRRFGPLAARWHAHAGGVDEEPLVPHPRRIAIEHALFGEGTAEREDQLLFALRTLVSRVADDVAFLGKRCGRLQLELECEDGDRVELATTLAQPTALGSTMFDLLRARLEGMTLQSPVIGLRLGAERLEAGGSELSLFAGGDPDPEAVGVALARLEAALGPAAARRACVAPGNRYEARVAYEPFSAERLALSSGRTVRPSEPAALNECGTLAYRVLEPRAIAVRVRGGRPATVALGGLERAVLDVAGPWRVDEAWWGEALDAAARPLAQDAYDVALDDGSLLRIVDERGKWFVCGTYD